MPCKQVVPGCASVLLQEQRGTPVCTRVRLLRHPSSVPRSPPPCCSAARALLTSQPPAIGCAGALVPFPLFVAPSPFFVLVAVVLVVLVVVVAVAAAAVVVVVAVPDAGGGSRCPPPNSSPNKMTVFTSAPLLSAAAMPRLRLKLHPQLGGSSQVRQSGQRKTCRRRRESLSVWHT